MNSGGCSNNCDDQMKELKSFVLHILNRGCNPGLMETTRIYLLSRQIEQIKKPN